ncbi:MAG: SDR family NAD(P)-dependent oxidoreductase [Desulfobacterales bacterium]|nr:SDR family NAD(P)-dependent oxidoreductase [Desulfobacterales bacterium]
MLVLPAHLGKFEEIKKVVDTVMAQYGRIDILVNNAGASPAMATVLDSDERIWDTVMNLNIEGIVFSQPGRSRDHEESGRRKDHQRGLH